LKHTVALGFALAAAWLLWSGYFHHALLLGLGAVSILLVLWIVRRMGLIDHEGVPVELLPRLFLYAPWLIWEIVKANVDVARRILDPRLPVAPRLIKVKAGQRLDLGRVVYANSITLTPGTVSLDVDGDEITVHALTREAAQGVETGEMDRKVSWLEGSP